MARSRWWRGLRARRAAWTQDLPGVLAMQARLGLITDVAVDAAGNLFLLDADARCVVMKSAVTHRLTAVVGQCGSPGGLSVGPDDTVYLADERGVLLGLAPIQVASAPTRVSVSAGRTTATVTFTLPTDGGGSSVTGYQYSLDGGRTWQPTAAAWALTGTGRIRSGVITGLTNWRGYSVQVRAKNRTLPGAPSAAVRFGTHPPSWRAR